MKKLLLSFFALVLCSLSALAGDYTFSYSTGTGSGDGSTWTYLATPFKIVQTKVGNTDINTTYATLRLYKNHTFEISAVESGVKITSVEFTCDTEDYATTMGKCTAETAGSWSTNSKVATFTLTSAAETFKFTASAGQVRFSSILINYIKDGEVSITAPTISVLGGNLYETTQVEITAPEGDIYYAFDEGSYTKYTAPLTIDHSTTLYAYAQVGEDKSSVKSAAYVMAQSYASLDVLLQETPTSTGWPVVVPIADEEIASFYYSTAGTTQYKNGVYLTRQAGGKNFELYKSGVPDAWEVGDKLEGTAKGVYQDYNGQWEISLLSWDGINVVGTVPAPSISYDEATSTVTITADDDLYTTFYTLDGSEPTDASAVYEAPFTIDKTTTVKAVNYDENDQKSAVTTLVCKVAGSADYTDLASIAAAAAGYTSSDAPTVTLKLDGVVVTGVNASNVFVQDATGSFLLYGSGSGLSRGDKLSGIVEGKPYAWNGLPEFNVTDKWASVTHTSDGSEPEPVVILASSVTAADANRYVRLQNLSFDSLAVSSNKTNYYLSDAGTVVTLRDNFSNLGDITWSTDCKYNLNVFVIPYKETIQYYAVSADDVEVLSDKADAELALSDDEITITVGDVFELEDLVSTKSDGALSYASADPDIAAFLAPSGDTASLLTAVAAGKTTITVTVAATASYLEGKATLTVNVKSGALGTFEDPFTVGDIRAMYTEGDTVKNVWMKANIVGFIAGSSLKAETAVFTLDTDSVYVTNLLVADAQGETNWENTLPVNLANSPAACKAMRAQLNLHDNPDNFGKQVWLFGDIIKYMGVCGLKNVKDASFDGNIQLAIENVENSQLQALSSQRYNLAGQKIDASYKGIVIIGGRKYINK